MKRFLSLLVLGVGLLPSAPIFFANASQPTEQELELHCRSRLRFSLVAPVYGLDLIQLRRCMDQTKVQFENAAKLERRAGAALHYSVPVAENRRKVGARVTQRTLNETIRKAEDTRKSYYQTVPVVDREVILQEHRRSRRSVVLEAEQRLLREKRSKYVRWQEAIQACRIYNARIRYDCVQHELTK